MRTMLFELVATVECLMGDLMAVSDEVRREALAHGTITGQAAAPRVRISGSSVHTGTPSRAASHTYIASAPRSFIATARLAAAWARFGPIVITSWGALVRVPTNASIVAASNPSRARAPATSAMKSDGT